MEKLMRNTKQRELELHDFELHAKMCPDRTTSCLNYFTNFKYLQQQYPLGKVHKITLPCKNRLMNLNLEGNNETTNRLGRARIQSKSKGGKGEYRTAR